MARRRFRSLAILAARAASDKKGADIVLRRLRRSSLTEYLMIVSVGSAAQMGAIEEHIQEILEQKGAWTVHHDGGRSELWRVLDYGGLLVHLMQDNARDFYGLDRLYHDEKSVAWKADRKAGRVRPE